MHKMNNKTLDAIRQFENAFPHEGKEIDLKPLIKKRKAHFHKMEMMHAINKLHIWDPVMTKHDLKKDLQIVQENVELLKSTNGFDILGEKIGIAKDKLQIKNTSFEFIPEEKKNYYEKKQERLQQEHQVKESHYQFIDHIRKEKH